MELGYRVEVDKNFHIYYNSLLTTISKKVQKIEDAEDLALEAMEDLLFSPEDPLDLTIEDNLNSRAIDQIKKYEDRILYEKNYFSVREFVLKGINDSKTASELADEILNCVIYSSDPFNLYTFEEKLSMETNFKIGEYGSYK